MVSAERVSKEGKDNVFAGVRMELYQPKVGSAEELAEEMGRIMQAYAASAPQSESFVARFIPIPRINRLLVLSHSEAASHSNRDSDVSCQHRGKFQYDYPISEHREDFNHYPPGECQRTRASSGQDGS